MSKSCEDLQVLLWMLTLQCKRKFNKTFIGEKSQVLAVNGEAAKEGSYIRHGN